MSPHVHLRAKDMQYKLVFPDGSEQIILKVSHYEFSLAIGCDLAEPIRVPKGASWCLRRTYDTSTNNNFNPDAVRNVGKTGWSESMTKRRGVAQSG